MCRLHLHHLKEVYSGIDIADDEKFQHFLYLFNSLLPFLKSILEEQMEELVMEERAGVPLQSLETKAGNYSIDEPIHYAGFIALKGWGSQCLVTWSQESPSLSSLGISICIVCFWTPNLVFIRFSIIVGGKIAERFTKNWSSD
ncbi:hypothetical protein Tco_0896518 [Tanacetum coccineum]